MGKYFYRKKNWQKRNVNNEIGPENNSSSANNSNSSRNPIRILQRNDKSDEEFASTANQNSFDRGNDDYSCVLEATNFVLAKGSDPSEYSIDYADYEFEEQYTTSYLQSISNKHENDSLKQDNQKASFEQIASSPAKENFDCINQQYKQHTFSNFYDYNYYATSNLSPHTNKEEFKHIYHVLRYIISTTRSYELHLEWELEDEYKFRVPKISVISKIDPTIMMSFLIVFPRLEDGTHFPDILPKFIPLFNVSTQLFLLSTQFMHILSSLVMDQQKKFVEMLSFRAGYRLDLARVIELLINTWETYLIRQQRNEDDLMSDNYMEMFDRQFQFHAQGVAGGDLSAVPAVHLVESLQNLPTTKLPFELLVSYLYEDMWQQYCTSFTQRAIEEFQLVPLVKAKSLKNSDNLHITMGLNVTEVLQNNNSKATTEQQHGKQRSSSPPVQQQREVVWIVVLRRIYDKLRMITSSFNFHHHGVNRSKLVSWIFESPLLEMLEQYLIKITFSQEEEEENNHNVAGAVSLIVSIVLEIELLGTKESRLPCEQWPKVQLMENVFMMFKIHWLDNGKFLELIEDDIDDSRKVVVKRNTRGSSAASPQSKAPHCYFVSKKEMFLLLETESVLWCSVLMNADMFQISTSTYNQGNASDDEEDEILTISTLDADNYQLA